MTSQEPHPILDKLSQISQLVNASLRPLPPRFGDGRYDADVSPAAIKTGLFKDLTSQALRIPADIELISEAISTVFFQDGLQDDKKYFVSCFRVNILTIPDGENHSICGIASRNLQTSNYPYIRAYRESLGRSSSSPALLCR
jgi:hypothetical protein